MTVMQYDYTGKILVFTIIHAMNDYLLSTFPTSQAEEEDGLAKGQQQCWVDFLHPHPPWMASSTNFLFLDSFYVIINVTLSGSVRATPSNHSTNWPSLLASYQVAGQLPFVLIIEYLARSHFFLAVSLHFKSWAQRRCCQYHGDNTENPLTI